MESAKDWFENNGGVKGKEARELTMLFDSKVLGGTGFCFKIIDRGRVIVQPVRYLKEWRRTVRHSKDLKRKRNQ